MAKQIVLKPEVEHLHATDTIVVKLLRVERDADSKDTFTRLPRTYTVARKEISMKNIFGYLSLPELARRIVETQNKMLDRYRKNQKYISWVDKLCATYSEGEYVLQDAKTAKLIDKFTGDGK